MIDTHFHLMCPPGQDMEQAIQTLDGLEQYRQQMTHHRISGGVIVQPSVYGFDNRLLLAGLKRYPDLFRGVAVIPKSTGLTELKNLRNLGVVGVRLNLIDNPLQPALPPEDFFSKVSTAGMFMQIHSTGKQLSKAVEMARRTGIILVVDHFGKPDPAFGTDQPGFKETIEGARDGTVVIKLSAPFRITNQENWSEAATRFARFALDQAPLEQFIAGTDWPFIRLSRIPRMETIFEWLQLVLPEDSERENVTTGNARKLVGL